MKAVFVSVLTLFIALTSHAADARKKVRIGWQVPWTVQGQLVEVLKHTEILAKNGLEAEFVGKTFGPELNELALSGAVDFILTADQPAAILFSKSKDWQGLGRLMYNRTSTYVPPKSPIKTMADLTGKTVGVPFGAAAERVLHEALNEQKISEDKVTFKNLGMLEHGPLVQRAKPDDQKWGDFDALSGFDPIPAILESKGLTRSINDGKVCALILGNKSFARGNEKTVKALLTSFGEAYKYYREHIIEANKWFVEEAHLTELNAKAAAETEKYEPNLKKNAKIRLGFSKDDFELMQRGADFVKKVTGSPVKMSEFVTDEYVPGLYK